MNVEKNCHKGCENYPKVLIFLILYAIHLYFADSSEISEYAVSAMNWAVGTGLMKGKSATTINPKDNATRAEIAAILHRFIEANK